MDALQYIQIGKIPDHVEQQIGKRPALSTVHRWILKGYRGVRLRVSGPAHFRHTSLQWIREFLDSCSRAHIEPQEQMAQVASGSKRTEESMRIWNEMTASKRGKRT